MEIARGQYKYQVDVGDHIRYTIINKDLEPNVFKRSIDNDGLFKYTTINITSNEDREANTVFCPYDRNDTFIRTIKTMKDWIEFFGVKLFTTYFANYYQNKQDLFKISSYNSKNRFRKPSKPISLKKKTVFADDWRRYDYNETVFY